MTSPRLYVISTEHSDEKSLKLNAEHHKMQIKCKYNNKRARNMKLVSIFFTASAVYIRGSNRKYNDLSETTRDFTLFCSRDEITVAGFLNNLPPIVGRITRTGHATGQTCL